MNSLDDKHGKADLAKLKKIELIEQVVLGTGIMENLKIHELCSRAYLKIGFQNLSSTNDALSISNNEKTAAFTKRKTNRSTKEVFNILQKTPISSSELQERLSFSP
jgi:hypothetical protein